MVRGALLIASVLQAAPLAEAVQQRRGGHGHRHEKLDEADGEALTQEELAAEERWHSAMVEGGLQRVSGGIGAVSNALNWQRRLEGYMNPGALDHSDASSSKYDDTLGMHVYQHEKVDDYKGAGRISDERLGRMLVDDDAASGGEGAAEEAAAGADDGSGSIVAAVAARPADDEPVVHLVAGPASMDTVANASEASAGAPTTVSDLYDAGTTAGAVADGTVLGSALSEAQSEGGAQQSAPAEPTPTLAPAEALTVSDVYGSNATESCEGCRTVCQWLRMSDAPGKGCPIFDLSMLALGSSAKGNSSPEEADADCVTDVLHRAVPRAKVEKEVDELEQCIAGLPSQAAEKYHLSLSVVSGEIGDWHARRNVAKESSAIQRRLAETLASARQAMEAKAQATQGTGEPATEQ